MALKRPELGSLKPGSVGDATILTIREGRFDYVDVVGEHLTGDRKIDSRRRGDRRPLVAPEGGLKPPCCPGTTIFSGRPLLPAQNLP